MVVAPEGGLGPSPLPSLSSSGDALVPRLPLLSAHLTAQGPAAGLCEDEAAGEGLALGRKPSRCTTEWPWASPPALCALRPGEESFSFKPLFRTRRAFLLSRAFLLLFPPPLLR